jgi:N-glycosylase/DNA lyase
MHATFPVKDYDLAATLTSGQAFRWRQVGDAWEGVVNARWIRLRQEPGVVLAETVAPVEDWGWLRRYLQLDIDLGGILATFPKDVPMAAATDACRGLRLLRQDPWETLVSFICSSTKQIVQIQQIIELLCRRFGETLAVPAGREPTFAFPSAARLASVSEAELRECKMGFRAPYVLRAAQTVARAELDLERLRALPLAEARAQLLRLLGVGRKIADCVLLFAYDFPTAFPVDVWVMKALRQLYFPRRHVKLKRLHHFSETHFGPYAGYAQQYLFHYMRTKK